MATPVNRYLRAGVRSVFVIYSLPLLVSLVLVAFDPIWGTLLFIALGAILIASTIATSRLILARGGSGSSRALVANEWLGAAANVVLVALPWLLGGWVPGPSAFIPSLVIALAVGFASTAAIVMTEFDATSGSRKGRLFDPDDH